MTVTGEPEGVTVRPAERADLLAVHRIEQAAFPQPWPFDAFDRFLDAPAFLVAISEGDVGERGDPGAPGTAGEPAAAGKPGAAGEPTAAGEHGTARSGGADDDEGSPTDADREAGAPPIDDGGVVGFVVADVTPNHGRAFGHVKDLAVHADCRGRGIGSTLLERALVRLAGEGATSVKLEVRVDNEAARSLYRSFGFSPMRRREGYYDDGEDAIVLAREL